MAQFVDTNIFLRFLTRDDPQKAEACFRLLEKAKNSEVSLATSESVIAEIVFVLSSPRVYNLERADVRSRLYPLIALEGLKIPDRRKYLRALDLYAEHAVDFEDALTVAEMERSDIEELYSYDRDFDVFDNITRLEP
jgi:predicted nucleic acid-binding protein